MSLFVECIVQPKIDIPLPIAFFLNGGHILNGSFIYLSHPLNRTIALFLESAVIKPSIIVEPFLLYFLFKLVSLFHKHDFFHFFSSAMLLFEL